MRLKPNEQETGESKTVWVRVRQYFRRKPTPPPPAPLEPQLPPPPPMPKVGNIVHFHAASETLAAIVLRAHEDRAADLGVFPVVSGYVSAYAVPFSETPLAGHWSWPQHS